MKKGTVKLIINHKFKTMPKSAPLGRKAAIPVKGAKKAIAAKVAKPIAKSKISKVAPTARPVR